jgi:hypothetical protein
MALESPRCEGSVVRIVAIAASAALAAALLAGCGSSGSSKDPSTVTTTREAVKALRSLVTVSPEATGWAWSAKPQTRTASPQPFTFDEAEPSYTIKKDLDDAYREARVRKRATSSWWEETQKASSFATLVSSAAGAESAMKAEHEFAQAWFPTFEQAAIRDIEAHGLGEHRWAVRSDRDDASFVEIGWTRGNLVLAVYVSCDPCQADVANAARRWATAIDNVAKAGPS